MKLSVCLASYNGETHIEAQVMSILNQLVPVDEIVISDDHSTDSTAEIIRRLQEKFSIIKFVYNDKENKGLVKNFENAILKSSGDIIFLSDQDDVWMPEKTQEIVTYLENNPDRSVVFTDAYIVDANLQDKGFSLWESINFSFEDFQKTDKFSLRLIKSNVCTGATMAFRRDVLNKVIPFNKDCIHDLWIAAIMSCFDAVGCIDKKLIKYRQHELNQIGAQKRNLKNFIVKGVNRKSKVFLTEWKRYTSLQSHLLKLNVHDQEILEGLQRRIRYSEAIYKSHGNFLVRIGVVAREIMNKDYFKVTNGVNVIIRDLVFYGRNND